MNFKTALYYTCFLICPLVSYAQKGNKKDVLKEVQDFYEEGNTGFYPKNNIAEYQLQQVVLIRHGHPLIDKKGSRKHWEAVQYTIAYDTVKVHPFDPEPFAVWVKEVDTIYSSPLQRALHTSQIIAGNTPIKTNALLVEFPNEVIPIPIIGLPIKVWMGLSRVVWLAGISGYKTEHIKSAKQRVALVANNLEESDNRKTVIVAHGFFNKYLKKELKTRGWQLSFNSGNGYTSIKVLSRLTKKSGKTTLK